MSTWALVPVKARAAGKQRLAGALPSEVRARLVRRMLDDVLAAIDGCRQIDGTLVMSPERDRLPAARPLLQDPAEEMNAALAAAMAGLEDRGVTHVAVIAADLPLLEPADIAALLTAAPAAGVALAPDARGTGTNAVCLRLPAAFRFQFGPGSFARHQAEAARHGITAATLASEAFGFDVDESADLTALRARGLKRYAFLG
ncbi:MAG TPA: 2-phospho-L-lactate guanylyltransferase [Steroidobacteraceae bacterium]